MKKIYKLLIFSIVLLFSMLVNSLETMAEHIPNGDGSVTITKKDIADKMRMDGEAKLVAGGNGLENPKYQLTQAIDGKAKDGQVGAVYLEDRLSTKDSFTFVGSMESYNPYIRGTGNIPILGDGQSLIFHGDDTKNYGDVGSGLGVIKLKNAKGLVFDIYYNRGLSSSDWQIGQNLYDPFDSNSIYFQGWSTDQYGRGKRETTAVSYNKMTYGRSGEKKVTMVYDAKTRYMTFTVTFLEHTNTHRLYVPQSQEYVYFSSTASTGEASSSFFTSIEKITYTPYRRKTLKYIDADTKAELKQYEETREVKLNESYSFKPKKIPGYDVVDIEGKLEGTVEFEEILEDEFVYVYLRKQATTYTYDLIELNNKSIRRKTTEEKDLLSINTNELGIPRLNKSVSKITITTPLSVIRDETNTKLPVGWEKVSYQTKTKNVYQIYNSDYDNIFSEQGNLKTELDVKIAIQFFSVFQIIDKEYDLDEKDIQIELSNYPLPIYENQDETEKIGYSFPRLHDVGFRDTLAFSEGIFNPLIPVNTDFLTYRGLKAERTSEVDETKFVREALGANAVATTNNKMIKGSSYNNKQVFNYFVKYDLNQTLTGSDEMKNIPNFGIPQPVTLTIKDKFGKELKKTNLTSMYSMGDTIYQSSTDLPVIEGYHFSKLEQAQFPIKVTNRKQEVVAIYEADQLYWGDVPWEFNEQTGELVFIDIGTLGESDTSPWNRKDGYKINAENIKTITFKENVKAPSNSNFLFDTLSKVTKINGLNKLNTSDVVSAYSMFRFMGNIEYLDLSSFNTSKIVNTEYMFAYMDKLKEIDLSTFDMSNKNVKTNYMFYYSNQISKITLNEKTILNNTYLVNPSGDAYTGNWQSIGNGSVDKPLGDFVGKSVELEQLTQKSPKNAVYVWEPKFNLELTINYFQSNTSKPVVEDLETGNRVKLSRKEVLHQHKTIEDVLKDNSISSNPEFEGYSLQRDQIIIKGIETKSQYELDSKMPKENLVITFYFDSTVQFSYPESIDFGNRPKSKYENIYPMKPNNAEEENYLSIIDTIENNQDEPNWNLSMSTTGFYHADSGVRLLADLMLTLPDKQQPIMITSEGTPIVENSNDYKQNISLSGKNKNEGLAVRVAKVDKLGQYNGVLKYQLQVVP